MAALLIGPAGKAPIDSQAKNGLTALHLAAQENHVALAQVLVDNSCAIDPLSKVVHLFERDSLPPQKNVQSPQMAAKLCALNRFFRPGQ